MRNKKGYHYRCRDLTCHARVTLLHLYEWYTRKPKCKKCGSNKFKKEGFKHLDPFYRDKYRDNIEINVDPCRCDGYGHVAINDPSPPHRIGSKCCEYRKDGTRRLPGDPDWYNPHEEDIYDSNVCQGNEAEIQEVEVHQVCVEDNPGDIGRDCPF